MLERKLIVSIDASLHMALKLVAAKSNMTMKNWVLIAIAKSLQEYEEYEAISLLLQKKEIARTMKELEEREALLEKAELQEAELLREPEVLQEEEVLPEEEMATEA